jgi:hypothetical protein
VLVIPPDSPDNDIRLTDVIEQRRLSVVDVTHDRDNGRTRLEIFRRLSGDVCVDACSVLLFTHRLKTELASDELDLIEVEALVDRDHQTEILESESHDLRCRNFQDSRKLTDRDEFVDANGFLFTLGSSDALRFHLLAVACVVGATLTGAANRLATKRGHRARDAR